MSLSRNGNNTTVKIIFEPHIVNEDTDSVSFPDNFFGMGVVERLCRKFLTDMVWLAFGSGHHHTQTMMMAENPMWENHIHNCLNRVPFFGKDTFGQDSDKEQYNPTGPFDILVIDACNLFDTDNVPILSCAPALEPLANREKKVCPPVLVCLIGRDLHFDFDFALRNIFHCLFNVSLWFF
jgi:hypothetical protein